MQSCHSELVNICIQGARLGGGGEAKSLVLQIVPL